MPTTGVWSPLRLSFTTSDHHENMVNRTPARPTKNIHLVPASRPNSPLIHTTAPMNMTQAEKEPTSGHGLGSTR